MNKCYLKRFPNRKYLIAFQNIIKKYFTTVRSKSGANSRSKTETQKQVGDDGRI